MSLDEIYAASVNLLMSYWRNWWDLISISLVLCCSLRSLSCFCIEPFQGIPGDEFFHWGYTWAWVGGRKRVNEDGQISSLFHETPEKEGIFFGLITYFQRWLALCS